MPRSIDYPVLMGAYHLFSILRFVPVSLAQYHCPYPKPGSFGQGTRPCGLHHAVACQDLSRGPEIYSPGK